MRITLLTCHLLLVTSSSALTDAWSVDARQHTAVQRTYKQGETWDMAVTLRSGLAPFSLAGATATFCWYTNATAGVWWTNSAAVSGSTVTAAWTPAMDTGASNYWYWIGIWQAGSTSPLWRVNGTIRLLPSPGFTPNALVPPLRTLDFGSVIYTNAPWLLSSSWISGSNALATALHDVNTNLSARLDALPEAWPYASILRGPQYYDGAAPIRYSVRLDTNGVAGLWREQGMSIAGGFTWSSTLTDLFLRESDASRFLSTTNNFRQYSDRTFLDGVNILADFQPASFVLASSSNAGGIYWDDATGGQIWGADWTLDRMGATPTANSIATMGDVDVATNALRYLPQTQQTNLVIRLVTSNNVIIAIGEYQ